MRILLSGVETNNKGAELMLYAILQELERTHPDAEVFVSKSMVKQGLKYLNTSIKLRFIPQNKLTAFLKKINVTSALNHLGFYNAFLNDSCPVKNVDYFIDGSGLLFSDKRINSKLVSNAWGAKLCEYKKRGTKIVFLPQGFGPFKNQNALNTIKQLDKYADLIFARERVSYKLLNDVVLNHSKVKLYADFTSLVEGTVPSGYEHLFGRVCIIPNRQMINKGVIDKIGYFGVLHEIIETCQANGHDVYFLNHEGPKDFELAKEYNAEYKSEIEIVTNLNALEAKGLISTAYLIISSRFHGVASALNGAVPCLATSWHHKYAELFSDFNQTDCVLSMGDSSLLRAKITEYLDPGVNECIRESLLLAKPHIIKQNHEMWEQIWSL